METHSTQEMLNELQHANPITPAIVHPSTTLDPVESAFGAPQEFWFMAEL
jgi:hypothetical protein